MNMNLRDVQYFAVVAEHRHLGRAAESLGLSQPALSMSLRRLEKFMQTKLVKRTPKGVDLTTAGEAVFAHARRLRLSVEDISREVADLSHGRAGHLRIGTGSVFALHLVPTACDAFLKEAPKVTLKIMVGGRIAATLASVRNGELDLAVTHIEAPRPEDLVEEHLYDESYVVYASAKHRLAKRRQLTLADLVQERWTLGATNSLVDRQLSQAFVGNNLPPPKIAIETANLPLRQRLVAASELLAFGSREVVRYAAARYRVAELQVKNLTYTPRVSVVYRKDAYLSPAARRFIEILKATAKDIAAEKP
jgi:DNA-binding transcriptional LysR family regulator